jgi:hypothetical protein
MFKADYIRRSQAFMYFNLRLQLRIIKRVNTFSLALLRVSEAFSMILAAYFLLV